MNRREALARLERFIDFDYDTGTAPRPMYVTANGIRQEMPARLRADALALRAALDALGEPGLGELRELSEKATPGPWQWLDGDGESPDELQDGHGEQIATGFREDIVIDGKPLTRDGTFAAACVNYVRDRLSAHSTPEPSSPTDSRGAGG